MEISRDKTGGRKKGTPNIVTADLRERVMGLLAAMSETIEADISALEPRERVATYGRLLEFVLPKMQRHQVESKPQEIADGFNTPLSIQVINCDGEVIETKHLPPPRLDLF